MRLVLATEKQGVENCYLLWTVFEKAIALAKRRCWQDSRGQSSMRVFLTGTSRVYLIAKKHSYYLLGLCVFALSFFIHSPRPFGLAEYSDLQSLFFQVFSRSDRWYGGKPETLGIPYVDFKFEYPPVVGVIFFLTSVFSLLITDATGISRPTVFYTILGLTSALPAYLLYLKIMKYMSKTLRSPASRLPFAIAGFGITYYLVYNFDIIAIAFATVSLALLIRGRSTSAGVLLGLSVAAKILTGIILVPSLLYLARKELRSAVGYFLAFSLTVLGSFGPVYMFASRGLYDMVKWHATWYCENCFYVLIVKDLGDALWRLVSLLLMMVAPLVVMVMIRKADATLKLVVRSLLMIPAAVSLSFVYSPQMNVMIAPSYLLTNTTTMLGILALSDFLNMLIMIFFFRSGTLCSVFGIGTCPPVWGRASPVQWIAFCRIALLWLFIVTGVMAYRARQRTNPSPS